MNKILVTGGNGFTGKYVCQYLREQGMDAVAGVATQTAGAREVHFRLEHIESISRALSVTKPDAILHLAGISNTQHSNLNMMYETNVIGTLNLLQALQNVKNKPSRIILASSASVYGGAASGMINESEIPHPTNHYGISKHTMELIAGRYSSSYDITIVRPFNYTGVGQTTDFIIPKLISHFKETSPTIELGNTHVYREFNDVRDIAKIYSKLLTAKSLPPTLNLCSGTSYSLKYILEKLQEMAGRRINVETNPNFVRQNEPQTICGDASLLTSTIGPYEFQPIENTLQWMLKS